LHCSSHSVCHTRADRTSAYRLLDRRNEDKNSIGFGRKRCRKNATLVTLALIRRMATVDNQIKKDHVLTLGIEEEFQIVPRLVSVQASLAKQKGVTDENNSFVTRRKRIT
jgi:hypothetical protein